MYSVVLAAQVAINDDGSTPDASAILDIKSSGKGLLIPRMDAAGRDSIPSPAKGLMVFVTDEKAFYFFDGNEWRIMSPDRDWIIDGDKMYNGNTGFVGIGTATPVANLDVDPGSLNGTVVPLRIVVNAHVTPGSSNGYSIFKATGGTTYSGGVVYGLNVDLTGGTNGRNYGVYVEGETGNYFSGKVGIGTDNPKGILHVVRDDDRRSEYPIFQVATDRRGYRSNIVLRKSRGTLDAPEAVQENDIIATYDSQGYDGSRYVWMANLTVTVDGPVSDRVIPSRMNFDVRNSQGDRVEAMVIKSDGSIGVGTDTPQGAMDIQSTKGALIVPRMTTNERNALPAVNGSIIYNTDSHQFNFYENGSWVTKN